MPGVTLGEAEQLQWWASAQKHDALARTPWAADNDPAKFHFMNGYFEAVDAEVYAAVLRTLRPNRVVEVGAGHSSRLAASVIDACGSDTKLELIDPYPARSAELLSDRFPFVSLREAKVQDVPLDCLTSLEENDVLFIDSSHVVALGNDVLWLYLEILPRLKPGVWVHIHDIFLPSHYPQAWVMDQCRFWTEQYLLQALLADNTQWQVRWSSSSHALRDPELLAELFPNWSRTVERALVIPENTPRLASGHVWPCSFWMQRCASAT